MSPTVRAIALVLSGVIILPAAAHPPDALEKAASKFVTFDNHRVHYKSLGEGKTALVFVHCWCGDMTFWKDQVPPLAHSGRLVLLDLPGHGRSEKPKVDYTMDLFAKAVVAVLDDAKVEKAVLAGHSMGTPVMRQLYRKYPERVLGLIAVDGSLIKMLRKSEEREKFLAPLEGPNFREQVGKVIDGVKGEKSPIEVYTWLKEKGPCAPQHVAVSSMKAMFDEAIWTDDPIKVPLLVINAKMPFWPADYEEKVRKLNPKVDYHVMDGVGHYLQLEKPAEFNKLVAAFLKKNGFLNH